jgi:4,5-DOPA dioxygenase extradiol
MNKKMPVMFIGHGSPMNAIENNMFVLAWKEISKKIARPKAILSVSAHWVTNGTMVNEEEKPKMIYDMYGFPEELYRVVYDAPGAQELAHETINLVNREVKINNDWGIDHGTWSVLCRMYPDADIPVYQLSIDINASAEEHYIMGEEISCLRQKGVLIFGSGNVVHNLSKVDFAMQGGYSWAEKFDEYIKSKIINRQYRDVINYQSAGELYREAFYTTEHFYPLLYVLGASRQDDRLTIYNDSCTLGSLSMTSYLFE